MTPKRKGLPKKQKKSTELFDFLRDITEDKKNILNSENNHGYTKYMITRFLSMNPNYLPLVDQVLNRYQGVLDNEMFHKLCLGLIPRQRVRLNYIKGKPLKNECEEQIKYIKDYFKVSENEAYDYYLLAGDEFVTNIKKLYGVIE